MQITSNEQTENWIVAHRASDQRGVESSTRSQTMASRETRNGLRRHPDFPRIWVSNPNDFLSTEEVWACSL